MKPKRDVAKHRLEDQKVRFSKLLSHRSTYQVLFSLYYTVCHSMIAVKVQGPALGTVDK